MQDRGEDVAVFVQCSVFYLIATFTYQQTKSWARIGRQERGACQLFHTKMKKKSNFQFVYPSVIFKLVIKTCPFLD